MQSQIIISKRLHGTLQGCVHKYMMWWSYRRSWQSAMPSLACRVEKQTQRQFRRDTTSRGSTGPCNNADKGPIVGRGVPNTPHTNRTTRPPTGEAQRDRWVLGPKPQNNSFKCFNCRQPIHWSIDCLRGTFIADHKEDMKEVNPLKYDDKPHNEEDLLVEDVCNREWGPPTYYWRRSRGCCLHPCVGYSYECTGYS